jgi:hypothetical protein
LLQQNDSLLTTQEDILSNANPLGLQLDSALFNFADQGVYQADEMVLTTDQTFDSTLTTLPPDSDVLLLPVPSLQLLGAYFDADFADIIGGLIQGL